MSGHRKASSTTLRVGSRVEYSIGIGSERKRVLGTLAYGPGPFHKKPNENDWCGVVLDEPLGKNNGTIEGRQYFSCSANCGVFVRISTLRPAPLGSSATRSSKSSTPSSTPKSMTPASSIQSFTGMFDSGSAAEKPPLTGGRMADSVNIPISGAPVSKLRPPTNLSASIHEMPSSKIPAPSAATILPQSNIRQMVEKIEIKRDEMIRAVDATQDISQTAESPGESGKSAKEMLEMAEKVKDLESKLNTLMVKRAEDRQRFKEFERLKIQCEQLVENKKQMAEKIAELSKQKAAAEQEAQEAREEQVRQSEEIKDLVDNAEMAVIDKEMAENRAEQLQLELEEMREKLEEARLDFEILKTEIEDKGADGAASSFQVKKLEEQNARYKEALLKLRDISAADRTNIQEMQKEIERKNAEINSLSEMCDKAKTELATRLEQMEELKEQVDMALGSQEMVEKLTEKNLALEDKVEELQKALDEEEKIKDLSNMIIEEKDEMIADLRDEVDRYNTTLVNLKKSYLVAEAAIHDQEETIKKFREVVAVLRTENAMLREAQEQDFTKVQQAVDVQKQLENIEFKTRLLDRKDLSRAIDMELRQLDIDQCYRHMVFLSKFFPESFFVRGGDHDAIAVLLYIPRMFSKCYIIERQILDKYQQQQQRSSQEQPWTPEAAIRAVFDEPSADNPGTEKLKQQIFAQHIVYLLTSIRSTLDKYRDILTRCDAELFLKLGSLYPELSAHEKNIDHYLDLLREDKLDETVPLDSLEKILSYLQSLYNIYIATSETASDAGVTHNKFLNDLLDVLRTGTDAATLDLKILSRMTDGSDAAMLLSTMETSLNDIEQFGKKIRRRMVSAGSGSSDTNPACLVRFPASVEAELLDSFHNFSLTVRSLKTIRSVLMAQYLDQFIGGGSGEDASGDDRHHQPQRFRLDDLEKACKEWTGNSMKSLSEMLATVMSCICKFCTILQQGDYDMAKSSLTETAAPGSDVSLPSSTTTASSLQNASLPASFQSLFSSKIVMTNVTLGHCTPLDQRALVWRAQTEQINDFRAKIAAQESDIAELKRALKAKIDEVSEMQIRRDLSEKKHKEAVRETQKLQEEIERLNKEHREKDAERERTLNKYNQEINELYSDNRVIKEKLKDFTKLGKLSSMGSPVSLARNLSLSSSAQSSMNQSLNTSLNTSVGTLLQQQTQPPSLVSMASTEPMMVGTDVLELQQQIHNLRAAMKRLAGRNTQLKSLLTAHQQTIQVKENGDVVHVRPKWYLDSLRRIQRGRTTAEESKVQARFQEFRAKLQQLKIDYDRYRCSAAAAAVSLLDCPDNQQNDGDGQRPGGWSRSIGELIRRQRQQAKLAEWEFEMRFRALFAEFSEFVKELNQGFVCESNFATFIASHVSKVISSAPELVARIRVPGNGCRQSSGDQPIPVEVTIGEIGRIQSLLLC